MGAPRNPYCDIPLTATRLREIVSYDLGSGFFTRLVPVGNAKAGVVIARPSPVGYLRMRVDGKLYTMHRLAWLYVTGDWPPYGVDHVNGVKTDNRFSNLRAADQSQNAQNLSSKTSAKSGYRGSYFDKKSRRWQAKLIVKGKRISLGYYATAIEAHQAYLDGRKVHHIFNPGLRD